MNVIPHISTSILIVFILNNMIYEFSLADNTKDVQLFMKDELEEPPNNNEIMNAVRQIIGEKRGGVMETAKEELVTLLEKENPELRFPRKNSAWLIRFLRARKYDVPETRDLILKYYGFKRDNRKEIYDGMLPSLEKDTFASNHVTILPTRDGVGRRILVVRTKDWNPHQYPFIKFMRVMIMLAEFGMYEPTTQLAGVQIILDVNGVHTGHAFAIIGLVGKLFDWVLHCVPLHFEGIHVVNDGYKFKAAYNIVKNFLSAEVKKMIHTYRKDLPSLYEKIPRSSLPTIYGGSFPMYDISSEDWDLLLSYEDIEYKELDSYGFTSPSVKKRWENKNRPTGNISIIPQQASIEVY